MRGSDPVFAERVAALEGQFGCVSDDMLCVLAQSAYICWYEGEFEDDLMATCRAIGTGKPTYLYLCSQISPRIWDFLNEYVMAIQTWLATGAPSPPAPNPARVRQIMSWLGPRDEKRESLAILFLSHLVEVLRRGVSLSRLGSSEVVPERVYSDYSSWYSCPSVPDAVGRARAVLGTGGDELISGMELPGEPACQYRWPRKLDIKVCSIGALQWRGALPPDSAPKEPKQAFWGQVSDAFQTWLGGREPGSETASRLHQMLGAHSESKAFVVREFLDQPPPGIGFFDWVTDQSKSRGLIPSAIFADEGG